MSSADASRIEELERRLATMEAQVAQLCEHLGRAAGQLRKATEAPPPPKRGADNNRR